MGTQHHDNTQRSDAPRPMNPIAGMMSGLWKSLRCMVDPYASRAEQARRRKCGKASDLQDNIQGNNYLII